MTFSALQKQLPTLPGFLGLWTIDGSFFEQYVTALLNQASARDRPPVLAPNPHLELSAAELVNLDALCLFAGCMPDLLRRVEQFVDRFMPLMSPSKKVSAFQRSECLFTTPISCAWQ
jgi:hypothetical protein